MVVFQRQKAETVSPRLFPHGALGAVSVAGGAEQKRITFICAHLSSILCRFQTRQKCVATLFLLMQF